MAFVTVATVGELVPGVGKGVTVAGRPLALFLVDGTVYAIDATCSHRDLPLADGACLDGEVICPWHGARFDLKTGEARCEPARGGIRSYPVRLAGDQVQVEVEGKCESPG